MPGAAAVTAAADPLATDAGDVEPEVVTVHVLGRVRDPGVYRLPAGARVADAVAAAGGLRPGARTRTLNLARILVDGEQVLVGRPGTPSGTSPGAPGVPGAPGAGGPLDINTATAEELEALPGIGPVLAGRIVAWREANGPFPAVEILAEVPGIGPVLLENLRPLVAT